ncbi:hypothetical protein B0O99DRAFT_615482 [Bisporella sp. PMI_857]|nr:hypothetical protein B0O99DRAFT_615482 [Bisporella sp. PMI_857]
MAAGGSSIKEGLVTKGNNSVGNTNTRIGENTGVGDSISIHECKSRSEKESIGLQVAVALYGFLTGSYRQCRILVGGAERA